MLILRDYDLDEQTDWETNVYPKLVGNLIAVEQTTEHEKIIGWAIKEDIGEEKSC